MNLPKAVTQLAEKPVGEMVETLVTGMVQFGKDTVKAVADTGKIIIRTAPNRTMRERKSNHAHPTSSLIKPIIASNS